MESNTDINIDDTLEKCVSDGSRKSFFLFAGAGSGKTHSLVMLLKKINEKWGNEFNNERRRVAVITYTNAATEEIISRLGNNPLFYVSTIHSFVWEVIKPFQVDIKKYYIEFKEDEKREIQGKIERARISTRQKYTNDLEKIENRISKAKNISKFTYNPDGNNYDYNALNHSDVIKIAAKMISESDLIQLIIAQQYPFLLIDESQDTKKELINAFFQIEKNYKSIFTLGLFGDQKQRIYTDGEEHIVDIIPDTWEKPVKRMNYRCDRRIIELANKIGGFVDEYAEQNSRNDAENGFVHLFLIKNMEQRDKAEIEATVKSQMNNITQDNGWNPQNGNVKMLVLEHMMAARRLKFAEFLGQMRNVTKYSQILYQGLVNDMDVFTKRIFPLIKYMKDGNSQLALQLLKDHSPMLQKLPKQAAYEALAKCKSVTEELSKIDLRTHSIKDLLQLVAENDLFKLPDVLVEALSISSDSSTEGVEEKSALSAWINVMDLPAIQVQIFADYISGRTIFDTHQGVKGLEFPRVQVIIDENESNSFLFSYDKLWKVKPLSDTDIRNMNEGKESTIDRTMRLFYVVCTRAIHSLAITMYTDEPERAKATAIANEWFNENEITIID